MSFVTLTQQDFSDWADRQFGTDKWYFTQPKRGTELVLVHPTDVNGIEYHIYTSVAGQATRGLGKDAIRVVLFDRYSLKPVNSAKHSRVHRTEGATTVWSRLESRLDDCKKQLDDLVDNRRFCGKCSPHKPHKIQRTNSKTGETFWGCSAFPNCGNTNWYAERVKKYPLEQIPSDLQDLIEQQEVKPQPVEPPKSVDYVPIVHTDQESLPIIDEDKCSPCSDYPHHNYPFEYFNRVQSVVLQNNLYEQDINLVAGTATSTGKTILGELFMGHTLKMGMKVCYVSPLKSLTEEKRADWEKSWVEQHGYKLAIMTGDYGQINDKRAEELNNADIICMTAEMADSRTRNHQSEKSEWLKKVGLLILDESHIISTGRGHPVEVGMMRFSKLVPESRIVFLSATLPNVHDFKTWLTKLNNKQTVVINSDWRPTELKWHFIPHITGGSYYEIQQNKIDLVVQSVMSKPDEKFLIFTHDKNTGRRLETLFNEAGTKTKFHNADLGLSDRMDIENDFSNKQDGLRVLIATSTLAWGRTLPARNVVITGVTRGMNPVDELDIIQMGGRAGRKGVDPCGDVHFICDNPKRWKQILANPRKVTSTLLNKSILGFHILAEIKNGEVWNLDSLKVWFERTLAILQKDIDYNLVNDSLTLLRNLGMMKIDERGIYNLTALGKISATMYFLPEDVAHWANTFNEIDKTNSWDSDLALAWVIGGVPSSQLGYVPRVEDTTCRTYYENLMKVLPTVNATLSVHAAFMYDLICGRGNSHYIRNLQNDIDRINQAFTWMNSIFKWNRDYLFDTLPVRVKYGIGPELVELCKLPKIGGVRAKKLYSLGIKSISDVLDQPKKVQQVVGVSAMPDVLRTARVMQRLKNSD